MQTAGCDLLFDLTQLAVMFLWEALKNIRTFLKLAKQAETYFAENSVDAVVLIDYPGFNWWIAKRAKRAGIPVYYYGVPQMWAWMPGRVKKLRKYVDHTICKLPFEVDWFEKRNCHATYVGHPYFDQLEAQQYDMGFIESNFRPDEKLITLLPGSRNQEIERNLATLVRAASKVKKRFPETRVAVASFNQKQLGRAKEIVNELVAEEDVSPPELFVGRTPELMSRADSCLACSGSVSLELLYHRKPTVIVYRISHFLMFLQSFIMRTRFITLVNLMAAKKIDRTSRKVYDPDAADSDPAIMPEYLSVKDTSDRVAKRVCQWMDNPDEHEMIVKRLDGLAQKYARSGATQRAADYILNSLSIKSDKSSRDCSEFKKAA